MPTSRECCPWHDSRFCRSRTSCCGLAPCRGVGVSSRAPLSRVPGFSGPAVALLFPGRWAPFPRATPAPAAPVTCETETPWLPAGLQRASSGVGPRSGSCWPRDAARCEHGPASRQKHIHLAAHVSAWLTLPRPGTRPAPSSGRRGAGPVGGWLARYPTLFVGEDGVAPRTLLVRSCPTGGRCPRGSSSLCVCGGTRVPRRAERWPPAPPAVGHIAARHLSSWSRRLGAVGSAWGGVGRRGLRGSGRRFLRVGSSRCAGPSMAPTRVGSEHGIRGVSQAPHLSAACGPRSGWGPPQ